MTITRRRFLRTTMAAVAATGLEPVPFRASLIPGSAAQIPEDRFDPWIEVDRTALKHNVAEVHRITSGRPILAVIKNNAYGLGLTLAARLLEPFPEVKAFAVVKTESAFALREAGIKKPVLLMARFHRSVAADLVRQQIQPCLLADDALDLIESMGRALGAPVPAQVYLDTGMSRMGVPYHRALPWIESLIRSGKVSIQGTFMGFTEDPDFDREQLKRFLAVANQASEAGMELGLLHAASSSAVFELPEAHLNMVRPGMALYGGFPNDPREQRKKASLHCTVRLKARVVRVERLRAGDSVSYGRNYVAHEPTWVATIPVGHTDGYPRRAVEGARVLIGTRTYPVIGAVSASHTIVEVGREESVQVGDIVTLIGSEAPEVNPNWISVETGVSVYDLFMHLNPSLPRILV